MPELELRPATAEDMDAFDFVVKTVFAGHVNDDPPPPMQPDWTLCAFEDGAMATTFAAYPFKWKLNGASVDAAGVTAVGTLPHKRRRGYLRRIMLESFRRQREAGQALAILWASHAAIYQRFGYAVTARAAMYDVAPRDLRFVLEDSPPGAVRLTIDPELDTLREVYRGYIAQRNGELHRLPVMWDLQTLRAEKEERPVYHAIYEEGGVAQGYVSYTTRAGVYDVRPEESMRLTVRELIWLTPHAYVALWTHLAEHDLVHRIVYDNAPEDDPIFDLIHEPRMLRRHTRDGILTRVVDVASALPLRPYGQPGVVRLQVTDPDCAWNAGVWELETDGPSSRVRPVEGGATVQAPIHSVASMLTGYRSVSELVRSGRAELVGDADLALWDGMFATPHRPHCFNGF